VLEKILVSIVIIINRIDMIVSVDTLIVTRVVEAEAVIVTVNIKIR
jgi:hypothetical protein